MKRADLPLTIATCGLESIETVRDARIRRPGAEEGA
jgi:hypothetical protein